MNTNPRVDVGSWGAVSKKAYWDRNVPLEKWKEGVSVGHPSYLPGAVTGMNVFEFAHFYGVENFVRDWPELRARLPDAMANKVGMYDLVWSQLSGGGWNLRPFKDFNALPERRRQFMIAVAKAPGSSIYGIAKSLGMQYRRAHGHAVNLVQSGKIRGKEVLESGRRKTRLYPVHRLTSSSD